MAQRSGWKTLPIEVPEFVHELFEELREEYGDLHGVSPSQGMAVSALVYVADARSLESALKSYREESKRRGIQQRQRKAS